MPELTYYFDAHGRVHWRVTQHGWITLGEGVADTVEGAKRHEGLRAGYRRERLP